MILTLSACLGICLLHKLETQLPQRLTLLDDTAVYKGFLNLPLHCPPLGILHVVRALKFLAIKPESQKPVG